MKTLVLFLILLVVTLALSGCARTLAEIPEPPSSTTPLVEYSSDEGKVWYDIIESDVVHFSSGSVVQIRKTEEEGAGAAFVITVREDFLPYTGSVTEEEGIMVIDGPGTLRINVDGGYYAKIVLE